MPLRPTDLHRIPLFDHIPDEHLAQVLQAFEHRELRPGDVLFEAGSVADRLVLLASGSIEVRHGDDRLTIRPVAPVGELGALAGLQRATTAVAAEPSEVLTIPTEQLVALFEKHGDIGFHFHQNLMHILAEKIVRDRRRMEQLRTNLIQTQKTIKRLREALLPAEDTALHRMMFEELDALVEQNRRGHYVVDVPQALPTSLRLDDGTERRVTAMSNEQLHLELGPGLRSGSELTAVLVLPDGEIPVSGTVQDTGTTPVVHLDALIEEYASRLERHLVRLQLLDIVL